MTVKTRSENTCIYEISMFAKVFCAYIFLVKRMNVSDFMLTQRALIMELKCNVSLHVDLHFVRIYNK